MQPMRHSSDPQVPREDREKQVTAKGAKDAHADCAASCVKGGASPVFVTDGKVYKIDDASKVADHVGHKVTISGDIKGDTVHVESVKM